MVQGFYKYSAVSYNQHLNQYLLLKPMCKILSVSLNMIIKTLCLQSWAPPYFILIALYFLQLPHYHRINETIKIFNSYNIILKKSALTEVSKVSRLLLRYCRSRCSTPIQLFTKKCLHFPHFYYWTPLHHVSCVWMWLKWFYAVLLWFDSLMMVCCELKHVQMFK